MLFTQSQIKIYGAIFKTVKQVSSSNPYAIILNSIRLLFAIFVQNNIELVANLLYGNDSIVFVTRYIHYDNYNYNEIQRPTSLYWNKCQKNGDNGVLITSEPIQNYDSVLFPESIICIVNYKLFDVVLEKI